VKTVTLLASRVIRLAGKWSPKKKTDDALARSEAKDDDLG